uniref:RHS repeat-associated core domain-containing protein n=1 Tax=Paractinoplanes polyasparticus TaxID=2856853 RepID=UPI001C85D03B
MVEETGPAGTVYWEFWPNGSVPVAQTDAARQVRTIVCNPAGTPTDLIAPGGQATTVVINLWGRTRGPAGTPLRFPGQHHDAETGLHYNRFRYYDPATARCLSLDPLRPVGGPHPASYPASPHTYADPLGLTSCKPTPHAPYPSVVRTASPVDGTHTQPPGLLVPGWTGFRASRRAVSSYEKVTRELNRHD